MMLKVYYICDRKKCEKCYPECNRTSDHNHALHKDYIPDINKLFTGAYTDVTKKIVNDVAIIEKEELENGK